MPEPDATTVFVRTTTPLAAEVDGELVMLDPATSRYYGLADTGMRIWQLLETPRSVEEITAVLVEEYAVDHDTCTAETLAFVGRLESAGLVTEAERTP